MFLLQSSVSLRFQKGEPDLDCVAKMILHDWQRGNLPWFVMPPMLEDTDEVKASAEEGGEEGKEGEEGDDADDDEEDPLIQGSDDEAGPNMVRQGAYKRCDDQ